MTAGLQTSNMQPHERAWAAAAADIAAVRREYYFSPPGWLAQRLLALLEDQRDAPILWLLLNVSVTTAPCAVALYTCGARSHLLGAAYLVGTFVLYLQRFLLALHCTEHRRLFRRGGVCFNGVVWLTCLCIVLWSHMPRCIPVQPLQLNAHAGYSSRLAICDS